LLLVVDNGSIYTKNLVNFLSEKKIKFISQKFDEVNLSDMQQFNSFILSGRRKNDRKINAVNSKIIKYAISENGRDYATGLLRMMSGVEQDLATEMSDSVLWEALAIIFGGGLENISSGMDVVRELQRRYISDYMTRMRWVGIDKTVDSLAPGLLTYVNQDLVQEYGTTA